MRAKEELPECPVATAVSLIGGKWKLLILRNLKERPWTKLPVPPRMILFLKVGVCGGFTTFSTFALESSDLIRDGHMGIALCYVLLSVLVGVLAIFAVEYLTVR